MQSPVSITLAGRVVYSRPSPPEVVYLVKGEVELTVGDETQIVRALVVFKVGSNVYHKLVALTDIEFVIDRSGG